MKDYLSFKLRASSFELQGSSFKFRASSLLQASSFNFQASSFRNSSFELQVSRFSRASCKRPLRQLKASNFLTLTLKSQTSPHALGRQRRLCMGYRITVSRYNDSSINDDATVLRAICSLCHSCEYCLPIIFDKNLLPTKLQISS